MLTKKNGEAFPAEGAAGANTQYLWMGQKAAWLGQMEGEEGGSGGRKPGRSRPDCNVIFVPCCGAVGHKPEHGSESTRKLLKLRRLGPSSRVSDSEGLGGAQKLRFLTRAQGMLLVQWPLFGNHCHRVCVFGQHSVSASVLRSVARSDVHIGRSILKEIMEAVLEWESGDKEVSEIDGRGSRLTNNR